MLKLFLPLLTVLFLSGNDDIVRRHDVEDARYLELGQTYGATVSKFSGGTGTLIRPTWVVTAAHVADASYFRDYMDIAGQRYTIKRTIIHPGFTMAAGVQHDIALVELTEPVTDVTPARLYGNTDEVGKEIIFAGTGWASTGEHGIVDEHLIRDGQLRAAQNRVDGITGNYLRFTFDSPESGNALPLEGISGPGDSGGPALWFDGEVAYLMGVSSHQGGIGQDGRQGVYGVLEYYSRISDYHDWILNQIGESN